jgi:V8-like Glu-specific endopeptidase
MARRAIPENNLVYPAMITIDSAAQGSGFYLNNGSNIYLVTAKHVILNNNGKPIGNIANILSYPSELFSKGKILIDIDLNVQQNNKNIMAHSTHDVAVICIGSLVPKDNAYAVSLRPGIFIKQSAGSGMLGVHINSVTLFNNVLISNQVYVFGYPNSIGIKNIPQIDYDVPLLRTGIIAGINQDKGFIILDCPIYQGNSGGPVVQVEQQDLTKYIFTVIGVVSQFVPFAELWENKTNRYTNINISNSGYAVVVPIDKVLELIK